MKKTMVKILSLFFFTFLLHNLTFSQSPYYHQVYSATSPDGLTWTKQNVLLFDHASVPGSVIDTNGTIFLYFDYFASTSSTEQLSVASSTDGITFTTSQEVQITGSSVIRRVDPTALLLPDGSIRLFYIDFDVSPNTKDVHSATSTDGIHFTEDPGIRFTKLPITDPDVFSIGDSLWIMYVFYWGNGSTLTRAKSKDGLTFTEDSDFYFDKGAISATMQFDSLYRTYYCANGIESFITDGKIITIDNGVRIDGPVCDPTVIKTKANDYIMYYKYITSSSEIEETKAIEPIHIYPNPITDYATLVVNNSAYIDEASFVIYDLLGNKLRSISLRQSHTILSRENLSSGIYFYSFLTKNKPLFSGKLIVE